MPRGVVVRRVIEAVLLVARSLGWAALALGWTAAAAVAAPLQGPAAADPRPTARVPRLDAPDQIKVDARLDEEAWSRAVRVGDLTQTAPIEGAPMSRETDVLLTYDADNIYVGIFCHDDPQSVRAKQMDRDAFVRFDDVVELWFDPFASERFAYWFQVTPGGSLGDALIADNGSSFNKDWDGIWYGSSRVTDDGWVAELAIPVKTLSFDPSAPHWGFNVRRKRVANGERGRWASPRVAYPFFQISDGGRLTGIEGLEQGLGLDVIPYVKGLTTRESARPLLRLRVRHGPRPSLAAHALVHRARDHEHGLRRDRGGHAPGQRGPLPALLPGAP